MKKTVKLVSSLALAAVMAFSPATALGAQAKMYKDKETGGYYYVNDKTGKRESGMKKIGKYYYYFDENGDAVSGFVKYKGSWYYFDSSNKYRMKTGWFTGDKLMGFGEKGEKYYFGNDGKMRIGKHTINGKSYDFTIAGGLKGKNSVDIKDAHDLEKDFFDLTGVLEQYDDKEGFLNYLKKHYKGYETYLPECKTGGELAMLIKDKVAHQNVPMTDAMSLSYNGTVFNLRSVEYWYTGVGYNNYDLDYYAPDGKKESAKNIYNYLRKLLKENGFSEKDVKSTTTKDNMFGTEITVKYTGFTKGDLEASISYSYFEKMPVYNGKTEKMDAVGTIEIVYKR